MFLNFIGSDIDYRYNTEPEPMACLSSMEQRCYWPRGKVLGGTSVLNGMMYVRGNREDYDDWAADGNPGWAYNDVLPFFKKSEDNLDLDEVGTEYHAKGVCDVRPSNAPDCILFICFSFYSKLI